MKEAEPGDLHYIFLQASVNELIISIPALGDCPRQILLVFPVNSRTRYRKLEIR
jgi:hypothetical protein